MERSHAVSPENRPLEKEIPIGNHQFLGPMLVCNFETVRVDLNYQQLFIFWLGSSIP